METGESQKKRIDALREWAQTVRQEEARAEVSSNKLMWGGGAILGTLAIGTIGYYIYTSTESDESPRDQEHRGRRKKHERQRSDSTHDSASDDEYEPDAYEKVDEFIPIPDID